MWKNLIQMFYLHACFLVYRRSDLYGFHIMNQNDNMDILYSIVLPQGMEPTYTLSSILSGYDPQLNLPVTSLSINIDYCLNRDFAYQVVENFKL